MGELARIREGRPAPGMWATRFLHRLLFYPTLMVVGLSHRMVLRRGDLSFWHFFARCHQEFVRDLAAMEPHGSAKMSKRATSGNRSRKFIKA